MHQSIPSETAHHVLWHYGQGGYEPGNFTKNIMRSIDSADMVNTELLRSIYPALVAAMDLAGKDPAGVAKLRKIAGGVAA